MESRWILYKIVDCGLFHMESTWSPGGVHMESVGEGKVHFSSEMEWNCSVFFVKCWPAEYVVTV